MSEQSKTTDFSIFAIALAGVLTVVVSGGYFDLWDTVAGIILLMTLRNANFSSAHRLYRAIWALCIMLIIGCVGDFILIRCLDVSRSGPLNTRDTVLVGVGAILFVCRCGCERWSRTDRLAVVAETEKVSVASEGDEAVNSQ